MKHRLEVVPGPGAVIRHGQVTIWVGHTASTSLLEFLIQSCNNVGAEDDGAETICQHVADILSSRDPEPGAPFAVVGPARANQWATLLHGPVQMWDGASWSAPTPSPGWLNKTVTAQPALAIGPAGTHLPRLSPDSPFHLDSGVVPGGGVILVPENGSTTPELGESHPSTAATVQAGPSETRTPPAGDPTPVGQLDATAIKAPITGRPPADLDPTPTSSLMGLTSSLPSATGDATHYGTGQPTSNIASAGVGPDLSRRPLVDGRRCQQGHFNHRAVTACAVCGTAIPSSAPVVSDHRPNLGLLLADDGSVYRVNRDHLIGNAQGDGSTTAGPTIPLAAKQQMAPIHSEIRLDGWEVLLVDRGHTAGTFIFPQGATGWERLTAYQPVRLSDGTHLSAGGRVLTFLARWPS